ncbi:MAG: cadherin repeat domain-containing protein, partial [Pseudanabaena sp.]
NEAPTALVLSNNTTPENVTANTLIGRFASTDLDSIPQTFTYSLVTGLGGLDNTSFSIINNELHIVNSPDFETKNIYSIRVKTGATLT